MFQKSEQLYQRAKKCIPGGVNSPARAFKAVGGNPLFIERAQGSRIYDGDGHEYIDYVGSWGPLILGHCHPEVIDSLQLDYNKARQAAITTELAEIVSGSAAV